MGDQTRPMDGVKISMSVPQEEEVALANSTHLSFIHNFTFPGSSRRYFDRYAMFGDGSGLRPRELRRWEATYLEILRKATIACGGQRLVLKTPANQARVPTLLRMFPGRQVCAHRPRSDRPAPSPFSAPTGTSFR